MKAVNLGSDTDTVAAVAGGLAGVLYEMDGIPVAWYQKLIRHEEIEKLCRKFCQPTGKPTVHRVCDIHSHVLFDLDDGARHIDASLEMIHALAGQGTTDVFCTSYNHGNWKNYSDNLALLRQRMGEDNTPVRLHTGCELLYDQTFTGENLLKIQSGEFPTMSGSDWILLEFAPWESVHRILQGTAQMRKLTGRSIIVAHVERCRNLQTRRIAVRTLKQQGCLLQINAYSLAEETCPYTKAFARWLLQEKLVDFIGFDAHRPDHRPPALEKGVEYIYSHCDAVYADAICYQNAEDLLLSEK